MNLKTSLQLSAVFPLVFAIVVTLAVGWWMNYGERSEAVAVTFLVLTGVLGLAMTAVIILYTKDILNKIRILNEWTDSVLKGNLDAQIGLKKSDDEVSRLSYALSKMLREIKQAYSEIHKEASEHKQQSVEQKRLADAAQIGTKQLSDALNRLRESQQEIVQKERLHVYEQVIRGVVHDFGEALTPIQGAVDILLAHPEKLPADGDMTQYLQTMAEAVRNARKSLKNLAGIYHAHAERLLGHADVNGVVERCMSLLEPRWKAEANSRGISIDIFSNLQSIPSVAGDESDIEDLVTNLIMNAIEAMPEGGKINLSTHADRSAVTLEVNDSGQGMTNEVRMRCLDPFYTTKTGSGTGMGLTIVNSVVRRYRGSLAIESESGRGTRVIVKLPVWSEAFLERKAPESMELKEESLSILLVDDDALSLKVLARILLSSGYQVDTATGGSGALEKIRLSKFDVAIVDKAMPGMDGKALATAIKDVSPTTPVIMLTGYADIMREEGDMPGCVDLLLSKPATLTDLKNGIIAVVGSARAGQLVHQVLK